MSDNHVMVLFRLSGAGFSFTDLEFSVQMFNSAASPGFTIDVKNGATLLGAQTYTGLNHDADLDFLLVSSSPITEVDLLAATGAGFKEIKHFEVSGVTPIPANDNTFGVPSPWYVHVAAECIAPCGNSMIRRLNACLAALTRGQFEALRKGSFSSARIAWDEAWDFRAASRGVLVVLPVCHQMGGGGGCRAFRRSAA